jgi:hypothetical protein
MRSREINDLLIQSAKDGHLTPPDRLSLLGREAHQRQANAPLHHP